MATAEQRFEADKKFAYRALQDARQYVTDFDRSGSKAEALYERLGRASRMMRPWSTDGTPAQSKKAIEYLNEITSILSEKIGPASRREFSEQGGGRQHAIKKTSAQLQRAIDEVLAQPRTQSHHATKIPSSQHPSIRKWPDRSIIVRPTSTRWPGGVKVRVVKFGAGVRQGVRASLPIGALAVMHPDAGEKLPDGTVSVHEDELRDTAD